MNDLADRLDTAQFHQFYDPDFQLVTRLRSRAKFCFRFSERVKEAHQIRFGKQLRLPLQFLRFTYRRLEQLFIAGNFSDEEIAEVRE